MATKNALLSFLLVILLGLPTISTALAAPQVPASYYGLVTLNGANLPDGTQVTAWVNGTQYATTSTQTYNGNSVYGPLDVPGDDSDTPEIEGAVAGDTIIFQVDGQEADQPATWQSGGGGELNLTAGTGPTPPDANFTCTPLSGPAPLEVTCSNSSTGEITSISWALGDGTTSTEQNPPAHTYQENGTYEITLTVTGPNGSDSHSESISVSDGAVIVPLASGGELSVAWTGVIFDETSIAGETVLAHAFDETWTTNDTTNLGAGWHVTIVAEDHLRGGQDTENRVIPVGSDGNFGVTCSDSEIVPVSQEYTALPTCPVGVQAIPNNALGETPLTMLSANSGDGMGGFDFAPHFQLLVPGTTIIDTYTTNIYVDIISGP